MSKVIVGEAQLFDIVRITIGKYFLKIIYYIIYKASSSPITCIEHNEHATCIGMNQSL
jgi:hypothetical protein